MLSRFLHMLVAQPIVYDAVQQMAGIGELHNRMRPVMAQVAGKTVLDIGAGTGLNQSVFPQSTNYLWLDNDRQKFAGFRARSSESCIAMLGDATAIGLADQSVDYVTCTSVTHHLTDAQVAGFMQETARVVKHKLILVDGLATDRLTSKLLWRYDRGSNPRSKSELVQAIETTFEIEYLETFTIYHRYVIVVAAPRYGSAN